MRILAFGDDIGLPQLIQHMPVGNIIGLVGASIRPTQHNKLQKLARLNNLPLVIQPRVKDNDYLEFLEKIRGLKPDLFFVNSYSMLLRTELLEIPPLGGINVHGAILPEYRGANPVQWAILNCEKETGVTMHIMTPEFDSGDILAQRHVPILFGDTWVDVQHRIADATEQMLSEELPKIINNTIGRKPQDESRAYHYHRRKPEDGLFTWDAELISIYNLIRALVKPHPGAFYLTEDDGRVVLDEYMSIPKLAIMKYGVEGGKTLQTKNVQLLPVTLDNLGGQIEYIASYEACIVNQAYKPALNEQLDVWFESIKERNDIVIFGIRLRKSGNMIGSCQLHSIDHGHRSAELQIRISETAERGLGYGTEATRLLLDFAFKDLSLNRIYLHVFSNNAVAIRVYEKAGFVREGILREAAHIEGKYLDVVVMGILRQEFKKA